MGKNTACDFSGVPTSHLRAKTPDTEKITINLGYVDLGCPIQIILGVGENRSQHF
jgi:hypothetical protein